MVGGKAVRTPLRLGARDGDLVEVVKARLPAAGARAKFRWTDLRGDEAIITTDTATLAEGQAVAQAAERK